VLAVTAESYHFSGGGPLYGCVGRDRPGKGEKNTEKVANFWAMAATFWSHGAKALVLGALSFAPVTSLAADPPKARYYFELKVITSKAELEPDAVKAATPRVLGELKKAFAHHPQIVVQMQGAPDPQVDRAPGDVGSTERAGCFESHDHGARRADPRRQDQNQARDQTDSAEARRPRTRPPRIDLSSR